jgi:hypothetical protein
MVPVQNESSRGLLGPKLTLACRCQQMTPHSFIPGDFTGLTQATDIALVTMISLVSPAATADLRRPATKKRREATESHEMRIIQGHGWTMILIFLSRVDLQYRC